jgi:ssDNA-binding Zn-finger/Zn-ribbon topoisomerase 1
MIIKNKDNNQDSIDYLSDLLERDFSDEKKSLIEREIKSLYSGSLDEETAAYFLNIEFKQSKNWILIHDLRLDYNGEVAQIDHLLIGRAMDIFVIDSKNYTYDVSISEKGDFSYFYNNCPYPIPSPIEQNKQLIKLLDRFLIESELLPKRLGMTLNPNYKNIVLLSPKSKLTKPLKGLYDCSAVMKTEKFSERFADELDRDEALEDMSSLAKVVSPDSLQRFAEKIVLHHKPAITDYVARFGLDSEENDTADVIEESSDSPLCPVCGKEMVKREAKKGKSAGKVFYGCSQFPKCRGVMELDGKSSINGAVKADKSPIVETQPLCPKCNNTMVKRVSKNGKNAGREFWGCESFPKCRGVVSIDRT